MAQTRHYNTTNYDIYSESTDARAVLYVRNKATSVIHGKFLVDGADVATTQFSRAQALADSLQAKYDAPASVEDWAGGKVGITGLPVI